MSIRDRIAQAIAARMREIAAGQQLPRPILQAGPGDFRAAHVGDAPLRMPVMREVASEVGARPATAQNAYDHLQRSYSLPDYVQTLSNNIAQNRARGFVSPRESEIPLLETLESRGLNYPRYYGPPEPPLNQP